jgi:uncharacterized protein YjbI with pentapeptide repeats
VKIEIKSRWDSTILFTAEAASLLLALQAAIKSGADLYGADLYGANLYGADLSGANLYGANLSRADLSGATLYGANLSKADLYGANLSGANLYGATLSGADLSRANLSRADLYGADLSRANLYGATLYGDNLYGANLTGAHLSGADLSRANLYGADLSRVNNIGEAKNAELAQAQTSILPEGNLVGWKKCRGGVIVKLLIPQKARRSNATGRKCRAEYAKVLRIFGSEFAVSTHDPAFVYRKGAIVKPSNGWDENRFVECGSGIHFYLTRVEAEAN